MWGRRVFYSSLLIKDFQISIARAAEIFRRGGGGGGGGVDKILGKFGRFVVVGGGC